MIEVMPGLRFPDVPTVLRTIDELKSLDLRNIEFDVLKDKINKTFLNVPMALGKIPSESMLYRARLFPHTSNPYTRITDIGVPPEEAITTYGRANKPHQTMFYASSNLELAMNEVCRVNVINTKDYQIRIAVVGEWRIKNGIDISVSNLCYNAKAQEFRSDLKAAKSKTEALLNNKPDGKPALPQEAIIGTSKLVEFFSDEYAKEIITTPDDYKISAAYMDLLMDYSRDIIQGINYPSVVTKFAGDNIVLTKKCFENNIELNRAFVVTAGFFANDPKLNMGVLLKSKIVKENEIVWEESMTPR